MSGVVVVRYLDVSANALTGSIHANMGWWFALQ
jgi:hypothetical protein